jgi:hypothetical protein
MMTSSLVLMLGQIILIGKSLKPHSIYAREENVLNFKAMHATDSLY